MEDHVGQPRRALRRLLSAVGWPAALSQCQCNVKVVLPDYLGFSIHVSLARVNTISLGFSISRVFWARLDMIVWFSKLYYLYPQP